MFRRSGRGLQHFCGGALVSERHVVTAASCVDGMKAEQIFVAVGQHDRAKKERGEMFIAVIRMARHPNYG